MKSHLWGKSFKMVSPIITAITGTNAPSEAILVKYMLWQIHISTIALEIWM